MEKVQQVREWNITVSILHTQETKRLYLMLPAMDKQNIPVAFIEKTDAKFSPRLLYHKNMEEVNLDEYD
jgi:hypothetical protein